MFQKLMACFICAASASGFFPVYSQIQSCPANINFSNGDISFWSAQTGLIGHGTKNYPAPNNGVTTIPEYANCDSGIQVISAPTIDPFGGFATVPVINGYSYGYSIKIGSTCTDEELIPDPRGFLRSVTYLINVPAGPAMVPYAMTYAYAIVLENGTHSSVYQPLFKATLSVGGTVISCASPHYYLPTNNNASPPGSYAGAGAILDTAVVLANGFTNSPFPFHHDNGFLYDVWTKGWTEVTFDLSPYRGQQVSLTFESDNCVYGEHFGYAYVALRNSCAGVEISGNPVACAHAPSIYSVPALAAGATYNWVVPAGWIINSGASSNIINVTPSTSGGRLAVNEEDSCANLSDTITVTTGQPTVAGEVLSNNTVCAGTNSTTLTLSGSVGNVLNWLSSSDGVQWNLIPFTGISYTAQNLLSTMQFRALVQNGSACSIDSSTAATIVVDPKTIGGTLSPANVNICLDQTTNSIVSLAGNVGNIVDWQSSNDNMNWSNFSPVKNDSTYSVNGINADIEFRVVTKSGVCSADTSSVTNIHVFNGQFPSAVIDPDSAFICNGTSIPLNATINTGTDYSWTPANTLTNQGNGVVSSSPFVIHAIATPKQTTDYVLTVNSAGCPYALQETFHVGVTPPIIVSAGNDTAIVANQPLQLNAVVNDPSANIFDWSPGTGLNFTMIQNPIALFNSGQGGETIAYIVRATNAVGCYGEDTIMVKLFEKGPDIYVPSGFTPNGDGHNDILRPICVGIKELNYFRVYNRWGEIVFSTSEMEKGWDGNIGGQAQATGNFVYMVQGIDYTGKIIFKKGNVMLVR